MADEIVFRVRASWRVFWMQCLAALLAGWVGGAASFYVHWLLFR